ncbi:uncharacterized protein LOC123672774 [Harmonia axyridis]|uniref:uncharacterized protein LOC123672774 n=1 Tax=Harmonia axyridis TaxID=115357 RepID=UPI001E276B5D|nr:uncharacterized protein LOC123672774 [Harmonia axyridis]
MSKTIIILVVCVFAMSLARSVPYIRGKISGGERMSEPEIAKCLREKPCIVTMDLTPMCGSDERTYPNRGSMECLNNCLKPEERVTIAKPGYCEKDIIRD